MFFQLFHIARSDIGWTVALMNQNSCECGGSKSSKGSIWSRENQAMESSENLAREKWWATAHHDRERKRYCVLMLMPFPTFFVLLDFFYSLIFKDDGKLSSSVRGSRQLFSGFLAKNRSQAEQEMKHFFQGLPHVKEIFINWMWIDIWSSSNT